VFAKRPFVLWKYFDRNLEPEQVTDSRLPEAKSLQRLTANERALSASIYVIIYTMCPTSHRSLTEKAKLIAKLFNTVPKHKGILLSDDESIKQWISHMKDVTNSKHQSMMTAISKVYHLGVVHAKGSWPGGPPERFDYMNGDLRR
jgi:hypothetical protein